MGRYVGSGSIVSGKMLSFDGATGSPGWEIDISGGQWSPASIGANHVLYFVADDANLHAIAAVPVSR